MNRTKRWQQRLLTWSLLMALLANSISVAQAQEPAESESNALYLPVVSGGDNKAVEAAATAEAAKRKKGEVTDQVIVHYTEAALAGFQTQADQMSALSTATGAKLAYVRELADRSVVVRLPQPLTETELRPVLARMKRLPEIAVVEPDVRVYPQILPNDPRYGEQWHYFAPSVRNFAANLPGAWDVTTGDPNLVVAVLDTGHLVHEDVDSTRIAPGYDLIDSSFYANDGDRRDPDPHDEGDAGCGQVSLWHGTHVAGTIGANSNNALGVTGINWRSKIQHVRVIGICGGFLSDVIDGIYWAAGLNVPGVPNNPTPARIVNMSIGIDGTCGLALQNAIDAAYTAGSVLIVSAGNDTIDAAGYVPAGCNNVITVAATERSGDMAFYSNYGTAVEIAAPGGFAVSHDDVNGVLSTANTGELGPEADTYRFYQGTSMAAPHVAGVVSLMLSVNPTLTPAQVLSILQATVTPFRAGSTCNTSNCGAGLVNAAAAVVRAQGGLIPPGDLQVSAVSATQVNLRWTDNSSDETGFKVERCQGAGCANFATLATLGANSTSYVNTGVAANTSYSYRLRATKNGVDSAPSNIVTTSTAVTTGCTVYNSTDTIRTIPDYGTLVSTVTVANQGTVTDVNVRNLNIEHSFDMDVAAVLVSPTGREVELFSAVGGAGANFSGTMLDDEATTFITDGSAPFSGSYRPSSPLSTFDGQGATGLWSLRLSDNVGGYEGWLYGWSVEVCGSGGGSDLIFEDGFESGGLGRWTSTSTLDGGDLSVSASAALVSTRGLNVLIDDTVALYVTDDTPNAEARYRARFHFDPNTLVLPNGAAHYIFYGYQGTSTVVLRLEFRIASGLYQVRGALRNDGGTWPTSSWYAISDAPHTLELDWRAATVAGANNGSLTLWIDGMQKGVLTGVDNDTLRIDRSRLGAIAGLDLGTAGSYSFDAFKSTRQNYIGATLADVLSDETPTPTPDSGANVVEEDLSLDDVGGAAEEEQAAEEEATKQQLFLPLISQ